MLGEHKFEVIKAPVDQDGLVLLDELDGLLSDDTLMVSIMAANNETGVLQPLQEIGKIIRYRSPGARFHTDATQAIGKLSIDLQSLWSEVDLLSFSAHKFHGPKGVGGLYFRKGSDLAPMFRGGGQEYGLRSGTTNTPALAGLAAAVSEIDLSVVEKIRRKRDEFEEELINVFPEVVIFSRNVSRLPNTSAFSFDGMVGEELTQILAANGIIIGSGSACSSGAGHPSKTILALGAPYSLAEGTIRLSTCVSTPTSFAKIFIDAMIQIVQQYPHITPMSNVIN